MWHAARRERVHRAAAVTAAWPRQPSSIAWRNSPALTREGRLLQGLGSPHARRTGGWLVPPPHAVSAALDLGTVCAQVSHGPTAAAQPVPAACTPAARCTRCFPDCDSYLVTKQCPASGREHHTADEAGAPSNTEGLARTHKHLCIYRICILAQRAGAVRLPPARAAPASVCIYVLRRPSHGSWAATRHPAASISHSHANPLSKYWLS